MLIEKNDLFFVILINLTLKMNLKLIKDIKNGILDP